MSLDASTWAWSCAVGSAAERLVLLALADLSRRGSAQAFPSRDRLRAMTRLDPKTIKRALKLLEAKGLIRHTGERRGRTGRIPVYRLLFNQHANATESGLIESGKSGCIPVDAIPPYFPTNGSESTGLNEAKNGAQNQVVEPGLNGSAYAEDAKASLSALGFLFGPARASLVAQGVSDEDARRLLGKARSIQGAEQAANAIRRFIDERTIDLRSRIAALGVRRSRAHAPDANLTGVDYSKGLPERVAA